MPPLTIKVPYTFVRFLILKSFCMLGKENPIFGTSWILMLRLRLLPVAMPSNLGRASMGFFTL